MSKRLRLCFFDSGIGGLNLLKACVDRISRADFFYFADNYNVPYGNLKEEQICNLVKKVFDKISQMHPDAAVVACNTVTAQCISLLRNTYNFPIIGIQPAIKQAYKLGGTFLVPVTMATYRSSSFRKLLMLYGEKAVVYPCENLACDIENNILNLSCKSLSSQLPPGNFSSVVLGCTHYIFIKKAVAEKYNCPIFDGMAETADHLCKILGIYDHCKPFDQKIEFLEGNCNKNSQIFSIINKI